MDSDITFGKIYTPLVILDALMSAFCLQMMVYGEPSQKAFMDFHFIAPCIQCNEQTDKTCSPFYNKRDLGCYIPSLKLVEYGMTALYLFGASLISILFAVFLDEVAEEFNKAWKKNVYKKYFHLLITVYSLSLSMAGMIEFIFAAQVVVDLSFPAYYSETNATRLVNTMYMWSHYKDTNYVFDASNPFAANFTLNALRMSTENKYSQWSTLLGEYYSNIGTTGLLSVIISIFLAFMVPLMLPKCIKEKTSQAVDVYHNGQ